MLLFNNFPFLKALGHCSSEMEEAYSELYQQFLRLQSLCMRQAVLLHKLTEALQKQKIPDGGRWNSTALKHDGIFILMVFYP